MHFSVLLVTAAWPILAHPAPQPETCIDRQVAEICFDSELVAQKFQVGELTRLLRQRMISREGDVLANAHLQDRWNSIVRRVLGPRASRQALIAITERGGISPLAQQAIFSAEMPRLLRISGLPEQAHLDINVDGVLAMMGALAPNDTPPSAERVAKMKEMASELLKSTMPKDAVAALMPVLLRLEAIYQLELFYVDSPKLVLLTSREKTPWVDVAGRVYIPTGFARMGDEDLDLIMTHEAFHLWTMAGPLLQDLEGQLSAAAPAIVGQQPATVVLTGMDEIAVDALVLDHFQGHRDQRRAYRALIASLDRNTARSELLDVLNNMIDRDQWPPPPMKVGPDQILRLAPMLLELGEASSPGKTDAEKQKAVLDFFGALPSLMDEPERSIYEKLLPSEVRYVRERIRLIAQHIAPEGAKMIEVEVALKKIFSTLSEQWTKGQ